jgi:uncharacterized protein (DUF1499 family)
MLRWLTRNWADTDDPAGDLEPLLLHMEPARAMVQVQQAVRHLPRWQVEAVDAEQHRIHATRRTRWFRFVDDIHLRLEPHGQSTLLHARSQSRVGLGDFGQNRRNLLELAEVLKLLDRLGELGGFQ